MVQIAYPLDDTDYLAKDVRLFHVGRQTGIINATGDDLRVSGTGRMAVTVGKGYAYLLTALDGVGGITFGSDAVETLTVDMASNVDRYDYVSVRYTKSTNTCVLTYVRGGNAMPTPVRNSQVYELILAVIVVRANTSEINPSDVRDTRLDQSYCGLCVDALTKLPTDGFQTEFNDFMTKTRADYVQISQGIIPLERVDIDGACK